MKVKAGRDYGGLGAHVGLTRTFNARLVLHITLFLALEIFYPVTPSQAAPVIDINDVPRTTVVEHGGSPSCMCQVTSNLGIEHRVHLE